MRGPSPSPASSTSVWVRRRLVGVRTALTSAISANEQPITSPFPCQAVEGRTYKVSPPSTVKVWPVI